ncbi:MULTISPECIES: TauD/TfdA family dioxygenase [unclassified Streptomyces]|uniref:TauD/TfdA family dioxygenase n=1 Tax=unclassified Streptomyces TaxID=2593676 RepID=UPI0037B37BF4
MPFAPATPGTGTLAVPADAFHVFSPRAQAEVARYVAELSESARAASTATRIDDSDVDPGRCPAFLAEVDASREIIDSKVHFLVYDRIEGVDTLRGQALYAWLLGTALGRPMVQNHQGWRLIEVYDRGHQGTVEEGARYHQTKQGSHMHNDAVNDSEPIDYLVLSCGQSAYVGGESILVDARSVQSALEAYPDALETLGGDFWFEKRGMTTEDGFFRAPIISYSPEGEALVRYFRTYIEGAHEKVGEPITAEQKAALDLFDAVMDQSAVQYRIRLERGQTLVSADDRFLHSRTAFTDRFAPREIDMDHDRPDEVNRYMLRMWARK